MNTKTTFYPHWLSTVVTGLVALVAGCTSTPISGPTVTIPAEKPPATGQFTAPQTTIKTSTATTPRAYRVDAAQHLYGQNGHRIFEGKMPPLLYAIGVLQVEVNAQGRVTGTHWMRAPRHAPEVMAEIEKTVRLAEPYPAPVRMGRVTYTDTWLWHKSGRFQLDTLTEGQL
jgi:hypothetical protein